MGQQFPAIEPKHQAFIEKQQMFFVATAAPQGRVNVSPKGMGTLRVLGPNKVAYLDSTGSGSETRAHLTAGSDPRLTLMMCAFEGDPVILRLYGRAKSYMRGTPEYAERLPLFDEMPGARQIIELDVETAQTSCGMGVPLYDFKEHRQNLNRYWLRRGLDGLKKYWGQKNTTSIDGLPTGFQAETMHTGASRIAAAPDPNA